MTATETRHARGTLMRWHGRRAAGASRWAVYAAYATTVTTLPSSIWRIAAICFHTHLMNPRAASLDNAPAHIQIHGGAWYVVTLSVVSEALAFLTVGLVSTWGEVFPRWIPRLGGRQVSALAATIAAGIGAALLTLVFTDALVMLALHRTAEGRHQPQPLTQGWQTVVLFLAYGPLLAWGPLLAAVTVHYHRRRRATRTAGRPRRGQVPRLLVDHPDRRTTRPVRHSAATQLRSFSPEVTS